MTEGSLLLLSPILPYNSRFRQACTLASRKPEISQFDNFVGSSAHSFPDSQEKAALHLTIQLCVTTVCGFDRPVGLCVTIFVVAYVSLPLKYRTHPNNPFDTSKGKQAEKNPVTIDSSDYGTHRPYEAIRAATVGCVSDL